MKVEIKLLPHPRKCCPKKTRARHTGPARLQGREVVFSGPEKGWKPTKVSPCTVCWKHLFPGMMGIARPGLCTQLVPHVLCLPWER